MARRTLLAATLVATSAATSACVTPVRDYHGYVVDEVAPSEIEPGVDNRSTVLARLGTPSTKSVFDENTWFYITDIQQRVAFYRPKTAERRVTAIRFGEDDLVAEVLEYDRADGKVIQYASRETPTRGRELGLWEQLFGTIGANPLPRTDEATPGNPTGR